MNFDESLTYLFSEVTNKFRAQLEKNLQEVGLHSGQVFILLELWKNNNLSQVELSLKLNVAPPTVNKMVKSLERNEFIECTLSKTDGRLKLVNLSPKGKKYKSLVKEKWQNFETRFFEGLNETEKLIFKQLLDKIKV